MNRPQPIRESRLRLLFCGTPAFAVPCLRHLLDQPDFDLLAVITQPDRPRGRGREISCSAVKEAAVSAKLRVFQPEKIRTADSERFLRETAPEVIVIIAYGQIIPARLLEIPRFGWINLHASLLPKYRGAAPIQWALANGETSTGVTSMRIDAGMDTGDILLERATPVGPAETTPQLAARLAELGAPLMVETLRGLRDGALRATPQNHSEATMAPLLKKEDGRIDWSRPAEAIYNRMRAFTPWPGAYSQFRGTACQLSGVPGLSSRLPSASTGAPGPSAPGTIHCAGNRLLVSCGQQSLLEVCRVKLEGRKETSATEFANGAHVQPGEQFT
jgi:methionyl-tRNA formyltransferase